MKSNRAIILIVILSCIYSCKNQESSLLFNQGTSSEFVYITPDYYLANRDSLKIDIPLEFHIKNNSDKNFDYVETKFFLDRKYVSIGDYNNIVKNTGIEQDVNWKLPEGDNIDFISRIKKIYINEEDVKKIFKKYRINKDPEKFRDSAKLVSYNQFRKDFPNVIKELERVPDFVEIITRNREEKMYKSKMYKIKW